MFSCSRFYVFIYSSRSEAQSAFWIKVAFNFDVCYLYSIFWNISFVIAFWSSHRSLNDFDAAVLTRYMCVCLCVCLCVCHVSVSALCFSTYACVNMCVNTNMVWMILYIQSKLTPISTTTTKSSTSPSTVPDQDYPAMIAKHADQAETAATNGCLISQRRPQRVVVRRVRWVKTRGGIWCAWTVTI